MRRCASASEGVVGRWARLVPGLFVAALATGCFSALEDRSCESQADCAGGQVCFDRVCAWPVDGDDASADADDGDAPAPIAGQARDLAGLPVSPARVCVYASGVEPAIGSLTTDQQGRFELTMIEPGATYTLFLFQCGLGQRRLDGFDASRSPELDPVVLSEREMHSPCDLTTCPTLSMLP